MSIPTPGLSILPVLFAAHDGSIDGQLTASDHDLAAAIPIRTQLGAVREVDASERLDRVQRHPLYGRTKRHFTASGQTGQSQRAAGCL